MLTQVLTSAKTWRKNTPTIVTPNTPAAWLLMAITLTYTTSARVLVALQVVGVVEAKRRNLLRKAPVMVSTMDCRKRYSCPRLPAAARSANNLSCVVLRCSVNSNVLWYVSTYAGVLFLSHTIHTIHVSCVQNSTFGYVYLLDQRLYL